MRTPFHIVFVTLAVTVTLMSNSLDSLALKADWVLKQAAIYTDEETDSPRTALAVRGSRVVYVGHDEGVADWIGPETKVIDGFGMYVYPGFVDGHAHLFSLGRSLMQISLVGTSSLEETLERIRAGVEQNPTLGWVRGRGWDQNDWPVEEFPTAADLDAVVGDRPAMFVRIDGHATWVSSKALEIAGITAKTPDPAGGHIVREENGEPTGILVDNAVDLVSSVFPLPSAEELRAQFIKAQQACLEAGLAGVHDMGLGSEDLAELRRLDASGELRLRVYGALSDDQELWAREFSLGPQVAGSNGRLTVRSVKLFADGALGSRGAALLEEYSDDPGNQGLLLTDPDLLGARALRAARAGYQVCIHAIGDRGNRVAIDALEAVAKYSRYQDRGESASDPRSRIEHAQVLHPDDIARFNELDIIASMQSTHCTSDMPWAPDRLGPERIKGGYVWRDLLNNGTRMVLGSDFPVESHDPRLGLWAAVTRQSPEGEPEGGWAPDQRLTIDEAVEGFTKGAAYASYQEGDLGSVEVGSVADFSIFDRRLDGGDPRSILEANVRATIVGGVVEYSAAADEGIWQVLQSGYAQ